MMKYFNMVDVIYDLLLCNMMSHVSGFFKSLCDTEIVMIIESVRWTTPINNKAAMNKTAPARSHTRPVQNC